MAADESYKCVLLSIRLSPNAVRHLLSETSAASIIASPRMLSGTRNAIVGSKASESSSVTVQEATPFAKFTSSEIAAHLPLQRISKIPSAIREDDRDVLILHSSGTTGGFICPFYKTWSRLIKSLKGLPKAIHLTPIFAWIRHVPFIPSK